MVELVIDAGYNNAPMDGGTHVLTDDLGDHVGFLEASLVCRGCPFGDLVGFGLEQRCFQAVEAIPHPPQYTEKTCRAGIVNLSCG